MLMVTAKTLRLRASLQDNRKGSALKTLAISLNFLRMDIMVREHNPTPIASKMLMVLGVQPGR